MPLDILAEVCTHLSLPDILQLARTSKSLRSFLLSRSATPIWAAARAGMSIPSPNAIELSEVQLALFLFGSGACQACNRTIFGGWRGTPTPRHDYSLMVFWCEPCRSKGLIGVNKVKRGLRSGIADLHPRAIECVPVASVSDPYAAYRRRAKPTEVLARRDLLLNTSEKLNELARLDTQETEEREILELRAKGNTSKRARQKVSTEWPLDSPHTARVEAFVEKRKKWADAYGVEGRRMEKGKNRYDAEMARLRREQTAREDAALRAKQAALKTALLAAGWSQELYGHLWLVQPYNRTIDSTPNTNPSYWADAKAATETSLATHKERQRVLDENRALLNRQSIRKTALTPYYNTLRDAEPQADVSTFPSWSSFLSFTAVRLNFWEGDDVVLDDKTWKKHLPAVKKEISSLRDNSRMTVVRDILMATTDAKGLSFNPADYPASKYDEDWFKIITHCAILPGNWRSPGYRLCSWPLDAPVSGYNPNHFPTTSGRVATLRTILEAAGLDEATATEEDLDSLSLKWTNYPHRKKRKDTHFEWKALIMAVESTLRGKMRNLTVIIEVESDGTSDGEEEDIASMNAQTDDTDDDDDDE